MILSTVFALFLCLMSAFGDGHPRPSNLPCKLDDSKCLTGMTRWIYAITVGGIPELGVEPTDPMYQELVEAKLHHLNYNLTKSTIEGFKSCKVVEARVLSGIYIHLDMSCPRFHMTGDFTIDGTVLSYPIKGNGKYIIDSTNYNLALDIEMDFFKKNDIMYVIGKSFKYQADLFGDLDVKVQKPYNIGREDLVDSILKFAKENPRVFSNLLQDPIVYANMKNFIHNFNQHFKTIPVKELMIIDKLPLKL